MVSCYLTLLSRRIVVIEINHLDNGGLRANLAAAQSSWKILSVEYGDVWRRCFVVVYNLIAFFLHL